MKKQYHILNGDALKDQFPTTITGATIIARECLVDGPVEGKHLEELYTTRASYLSQTYGGTIQDYSDQTVVEFQKILNLEENADVYLWFEDDLFCQVNFWFVLYLLQQKNRNNSIYLVRPPAHSSYVVGGLSEPELISCLKNRVLLAEAEKMAQLWILYQKGDTHELLALANEFKDQYPFILEAVNAYNDSIPANGNPGRPTTSLVSIMRDLKTQNFGKVFQEFTKRESIYGFGDLQVKRLFDDILSSR